VSASASPPPRKISTKPNPIIHLADTNECDHICFYITALQKHFHLDKLPDDQFGPWVVDNQAKIQQHHLKIKTHASKLMAPFGVRYSKQTLSLAPFYQDDDSDTEYAAPPGPDEPYNDLLLRDFRSLSDFLRSFR
jgi:hypothetical protein